MDKQRNFIGGEWVAPSNGNYSEIRNPAQLDELVGYAPSSAIVDVQQAIAAAAAAQPAWAARPAPFRSLGGHADARSQLRPGAEVESALATVALDAVDLLASDDSRLRRCQGPGCSLLFHDSSRPGTRRWCSTERCGNRVNTTTYRRRRAGQQPDD